MLKPNWTEHAKGEASIGALTFMLADLHYRTLLLEGKAEKAASYAALREAHEIRLQAPDTRPLWLRIWHPR